MAVQLLLDGSLETPDPTAGWGTTNPGTTPFTVRTDTPNHGTQYVRVSTTTAGTRTVNTASVAANAATTYSMGIDVRNASGSGQWRVGFAFLDVNNSLIGTIVMTTPTITTSWARVTYTATSPANTAKVALAISRNTSGAASGQALDVDALLITEGTYSGPFIAHSNDVNNNPPAVLPDLFTPAGTTLVGNVTVPQYMTTARQFIVHVTELPDITVNVARTGPSSPSAILISFTGLTGNTYWTGALPNGQLLTDLAAENIATYAVAWTTYWGQAPNGMRAGGSRMAARQAAIINTIKSENPGAEVYLTGVSNGTNQVLLYASFYDPNHDVKRMVFASGPHTHHQQICSALPEDTYWSGRASGALGDDAEVLIDLTFGYPENTGVCYLGAGTAYQQMYDFTDAATSPLSDLDWSDRERVAFIYGDTDPGPSEQIGRNWLATLNPTTNPYTAETLVGVPHIIQSTPSGVDAIREALLSEPTSNDTSGLARYFLA